MKVQNFFDLFIYELVNKQWQVEKYGKVYKAFKSEELFFYFFGSKYGFVLQRFFMLKSSSIKNPEPMLAWLQPKEIRSDVFAYYFVEKTYIKAECDVPYSLNKGPMHNFPLQIEHDLNLIIKNKSFSKFFLPGASIDTSLLAPPPLDHRWKF